MKRFYIFSISRNSVLYAITAVMLLIFSFTVCFYLYSGGSYVSAGAGVHENNRQGKAGGKLAIVIDDFGSSRDGVKEMMTIKEHLTFAVMPFLGNTLEDAEIAHGCGYEVIVHLPMEPNYGKKSWLGPKPILAGMKGDVVSQTVKDAFDSVPYAAGANIHMGSKASSDEEVMSAVLDVIKEKGLYFVDSRTSNKPKAKKLSVKKGVVCYERDVFIDGQQPKSFIKNRLETAADIAEKYGYAIAAGHVGYEGGKVTAAAIKEMLPEFKKRNIELVYVSELNEAVFFEPDKK